MTDSARLVTVGEVGQAGPDIVLKRVADRVDLTVEEILSRKRGPAFTPARMMVAGLLSRQGWKPAQIGKVLGREESTIRYYLRELDRRSARPDWKDFYYQFASLYFHA